MVRAPATSDLPMIGTIDANAHSGPVRLWLYAVAALVLAMVLVGGATRLTESGLSITEWKPVMGVMPPLSQEAWHAAFEKYQAIPQYREMNSGMSLEAFKAIYWWEWAHRLLGRVIGVAFLLPFLFFLWRGWIAPSLRPWLWFVFGLGALQGAVGWWMVASGLAERVEVSQYRLATHLLLACLIYVALIFTARRLEAPAGEPAPSALAEGGYRARIRAAAGALVVLVLAQIYLGALVAGLRAGYAYNTWPLIDGALVPDAARLFYDTPLWRNFFENVLTVQFDHRMLAYAIFVIALLHALDVARAIKDRRGLANGAWHRHACLGRAVVAWAFAPGGRHAGAHGRERACGFLGASTGESSAHSRASGNPAWVPAFAGTSGLKHQSASACSRSAIMSSLSSRPIESRTTSGPAPAAIFCASVSWRCVVEAG
jgi:heme a synthase